MSGNNLQSISPSPEAPASDKDGDEAKWFAMRDLTRSNAKCPAYRMLAERGFEVFTPMVTKLHVSPDGKKTRQLVPAIHDLLFVHATPAELDPMVTRTPTLQYRYAKGLGYCVPMTVRTAEMSRFIFAVSQTDCPQYYRPSEITPDMYGRRVRIVGGPMDGYEGHLLKARGTRKRRLIVGLESFLALAVEVAPEFITLLPPE